MSKVQHVSHESHAAAFEVYGRNGDGKRVVKGTGGSITTPSIYNTVPPPERAKPSAFVERYNVDRCMWGKAESSLQKLDVAAMLKVARSTPKFLRVVVTDYLGQRHELSARLTKVRGTVTAKDRIKLTRNGVVTRVLTPSEVLSPKQLKERASQLNAKDAKRRTRKASDVPAQPPVRPPRPRRPNAPKRQPVHEIRVPNEPVPMIQPVPVEQIVAKAYPLVRNGAMSNVSAAFARALALKMYGKPLHV